MTQTAEQIKVAANGSLYIARFDDEPTLPDDLDTALDPLFKEVGFASDDGATCTKSEASEDINVWQSQTPIDKIVTSRDFTVAMTLMQWNRDNVEIAFGGGEWSEPNPGVFRFDPPADFDPLTKWVAVLETVVGERIDRWVFERGIITGDVETQAVRNAPMMLPISLAALTPAGKDRPWYYLSNDAAAYEVGS
jgi:hypothetical protein